MFFITQKNLNSTKILKNMLKESDYKVISTEVMFKGWLEIHKDTILLPNKKQQTFEYMHKQDAVIILALNNQQQIVTIKEYRVPIKKIVRALPAGIMEAGEKPIDAAKRELEEETGYSANHIEFLLSFYPLIGMSDIKLHLFFAKDLSKKEQHLDPSEFIDVELFPIKKYKEYLLNQDSQIEASWLTALLIAEEKGLIK